MKKILPILIVGILVLSGLGAVATTDSQIEKLDYFTIQFSEPNIIENQNYVNIELTETKSKIMNDGKPLLPKVTKVYTYPFGTKISEVKVTFSEKIEKQLSKPISPTPDAQIISTLNTYNNIEKLSPVEDYSDLEIYPANEYSYRTGAGLKDGEHVIFLSLNLNPVQYHPQTNTIQYSQNANIEITYNLPTKSINFPDEYDMLIITPEEYTNELQPLVNYKNNDEVKTIMITLDEIPDTGVDTQESIKLYIKEAIEKWGITYLLLVGAGIPGEEQFPVRYAWVPSGNYEKSFPSDLYYADIYNSEMGFSNWDKDGDGKYAEYSQTGNDMSNVDMYPDVYLGKIPCNNANELKTYINKIIEFEDHNKVVNKILQIGGDTFPDDSQKVNEGEYANNEVLKKLPGYLSIRVWASKSNGAQALTKQNIANGFIEGVDFVDFSGHGSWGSWATHAPQDDKTWLPAKTIISPYTGWLYYDYEMYNVNNNHKFPVVVFNACSCNKYTDSQTCIGWKNIREVGGGIASFGASGIGYGSYGVYETERLFGWMEVHIFQGIINDKILGKVWANSLNGYISSFSNGDDWGGADIKTILEMSMFADPSIAIEDGKDPKNINIVKPNNYSLIEKLIDNFPRIERLLRNVLKLF